MRAMMRVIFVSMIAVDSGIIDLFMDEFYYFFLIYER